MDGEQLRIPGRQFVFDHVQLGDRFFRAGAAVDEMDQHARALDMAQELVAKARAGARTFDEPGKVDQDEADVDVDAHDSELRCEGGERIVGNLWPRSRNGGEQGGLARVGRADDADVGEQLELQFERVLLAGLTPLREARRLMCGGGEMLIAQTAATAAGDADARAGSIEIGDQGAILIDEGARRHRHVYIGTGLAMAIGAGAMAAAFGTKTLLVAEIDERVELWVRD